MTATRVCACAGVFNASNVTYVPYLGAILRPSHINAARRQLSVAGINKHPHSASFLHCWRLMQMWQVSRGRGRGRGRRRHNCSSSLRRLIVELHKSRLPQAKRCFDFMISKAKVDKADEAEGGGSTNCCLLSGAKQMYRAGRKVLGTILSFKRAHNLWHSNRNRVVCVCVCVWIEETHHLACPSIRLSVCLFVSLSVSVSNPLMRCKVENVDVKVCLLPRRMRRFHCVSV